MKSPESFRNVARTIVKENGGIPAPQNVASLEDPDILRYPLNDHGNAQRLISIHGGVLRYCYAFKEWMVWDGRRWVLGDTGEPMRLAKDALLRFFHQSVTARNSDAEKFALRSLDVKRLTGMLFMAQSEIVLRPEELDTDPYLLNFQNGTVDLRTGKLQAHRSGDYITKIAPFNFHPDADCPLFLRTLHRLMGNSADASEPELDRSDGLVSYLMKAFGYSATAITSEKVVFIPYGGGNNGKTTILTVISRCLGDYSAMVLIDSIMSRHETNNASADLADLRGARFVQSSETEEGQRLAEGKLKRITQGVAGKKIKACRKYENPIEFLETHKLWIDCNHKPVVRGTDDAIWNRLHPIPFTVTIPPEEIDRQLPEKLMAEAEGILAWLVRGAVLWFRDGLGKPPEVAHAVQEYRDEMDQIGRFIDTTCVEADACTTTARSLYHAYRAWAEQAGEDAVSEALFARKMKDRKFNKVRTNRGYTYAGIGLRDDGRGEG